MNCIFPSSSIGDVAHVTKLAGYEYTEYIEYDDDGEIIAIRALNVKSGRLDLTDIKRIRRDVSNGLTRSKLHIGDVLLTYVGTIGEVAVIDENDTYHLAPNVALIRTYDIDPRFMMYSLLSEVGRNEINKYTTTTSQPALSMENIRRVKLPVPPLPEQKKIAKILSTVDNHIDEVDGMIEDLKELKNGLMQNLLTKGIGHTEFKDSPVGRIPVEWEVKTLEEICVPKGLVRGPFGGALKKEFFVDDGYMVYEQRNAIYKTIADGRYYIDTNKFNKLKRFSIDKGDFIVSCSGTIGKIYQIPHDFKEGIINQALLKITVDNDVIVDGFFYQYFEYEEFQRKIIDSTQGGAMKNLVGMTIIKKTLFPVPPMDEQRKISRMLTTLDYRINEMVIKKEEIDELKKGLMQQLLTGKKRVKIDI